MRVAQTGVLSSILLAGCLLPGCVGSQTPYRPYKQPNGREPRPTDTNPDGAVRRDVELKHGIPHYVDEDTTFILETRKSQREVLDHVHTNADGSPRNAWNSYASDMNATLGAGTVREAPKLLPKDQQMLKKSEESGEGGGDKAEKADKGDKAEKADKKE